MNQLKRFLQGDIDWVDPSIITKLQQYDTIQMGNIMYQTADIIQKIKEGGCPTCLQLRTEVISLKFQLSKLSAPEVPPINLLLQKFFNEQFERTKGREFSRKELFKEVNIYLKQFNLILYNIDAGWRYLIDDIIKDTSKNYRKLKIRRKVPRGNEV
jgi:hypothetical protein